MKKHLAIIALFIPTLVSKLLRDLIRLIYLVITYIPNHYLEQSALYDLSEWEYEEKR